MGIFENMSPRGRRNALAVGMLAVLLIATAAAWLTSLTRTADRPGELWYLIADAEGEPIGWQVVQRTTTEDGRSSGYSINAGEGEAVTWSQWALDPPRARGRYISAKEGVTPRGQVGTERLTQVDLDGAKLTVTVIGPRGVGVKKAFTVGDGYIPKGRLRPTIVEAAQSGRTATYSMVVDAFGRPHPLTLTPAAAETRTVGGQAMKLTPVSLRWKIDALASQETRYFVADGEIRLMENLQKGKVVSTSTLVGVDAVRTHFTRAHWRRNRVLQRTKDR